MLTPWQHLTRFAHKVVSHAITEAGCVVYDWRGRRHGSLPHIEAKIYTPPPPKFSVVNIGVPTDE